jgi:ubiquinone/menaquinone biosynthesis C-methylase UbiE
MRAGSLEYLRCPVCVGNLEMRTVRATKTEVIEGTLSCLGCDRTYPIRDGIPDLAYPDELLESDLKVLEFYEEFAEQYDRSTQDLAEQLGVGVEVLWNLKREVVDRLRLGCSDAVLDVSCGTGTDLVAMSKKIGRDGLLVGIDLSGAMLRVARRKLKARGAMADLYRANASYLPFRASTFDALYHLDGLNTFGDKERAIREMFRTTKDEARMVIAGEGLAPGLKETEFGRHLLSNNKLFAMKPPLNGFLQDGLRAMKLAWAMKGSCYVIEITKSISKRP